jgi:hypothetical protein
MVKGGKPIKVCLTNRGKDVETPWATDLGPAPGPSGSRKVRLVNVPFLHAKPTWGDVIIVSPVEDGHLTWDRAGVAFDKIPTRILEDSGRWAMILDYAPHPDAQNPFQAIAHACAEHDIVCEGAWGPRDGDPGRAYLAVKADMTDVDVMTRLRAGSLPVELIQIHPSPPKKPARKAAAKKPAAKKPAAKKPAPKKPAAKKPAAKKPAAKPRATR